MEGKMNYKIAMIALAFTFTVAFSAVAENAGPTDEPNPPSKESRLEAWLDQVEGNIRSTRLSIKEAARRFIEHSVHAATKGKAVVTSRDRPSGPLSSPAHDRGAIDIVIPGASDLHIEAKNIARTLGPGHTTIVENPRSDHDSHTVYRLVSGHREVQVLTYRTPKRATAAHIHIQPDF
jgi:hypothetical protein